MAITLKPPQQQVIVVVGASGETGLATAQAAAAQETKLVLSAQSGEVLQSILEEINDKGGDAIYIVADVSRRIDVQRIADAAIEQYEGFDTWINNSRVAVF